MIMIISKILIKNIIIKICIWLDYDIQKFSEHYFRSSLSNPDVSLDNKI